MEEFTLLHFITKITTPPDQPQPFVIQEIKLIRIPEAVDTKPEHRACHDSRRPPGSKRVRKQGTDLLRGPRGILSKAPPVVEEVGPVPWWESNPSYLCLVDPQAPALCSTTTAAPSFLLFWIFAFIDSRTRRVILHRPRPHPHLPGDTRRAAKHGQHLPSPPSFLPPSRHTQAPIVQWPVKLRCAPAD